MILAPPPSSFTIRVGYGDCQVVGLETVVVNDQTSAGSWAASTRTIEIATREHIADQAVTLVHEILHAIWSSYELPEALGDEEAIITALSGPLASVIRDNPSVISRIAATLNFGNPIFGPTIH